jgi:hypothetical protein
MRHLLIRFQLLLTCFSTFSLTHSLSLSRLNNKCEYENEKFLRKIYIFLGTRSSAADTEIFCEICSERALESERERDQCAERERERE